MEKNNGNTLYPVFLKLENMHTLLVGAGNVALEKLQSLLSNSPLAKITVVAPLIRDEVKAFAAKYPNCTLLQKEYEENDLVNKQLVICATDNKILHAAIKQQVNNRGLFVNVADTPELCDFYLGSIVQKGDLKIAISTNGKSPTVAKRVKEVLNEILPSEIDELLQNMHAIRKKMSGSFEDKVKQLNDITKNLINKD
jgi:uncharacterized protein